MSLRGGSLTLSFALALLSISITAASSGGAQSGGSGTGGRWRPDRTHDGHVDLQGVWNFATITPLERPAELGTKAFLTKEEAADFQRRLLAQRNHDRRDAIGSDADVSRAYNQFWYEYGTNLTPTLRTSLITDPPNGRLPGLTPDASRREAARAEARRLHPADGPEDRNIAERCILGFNSGPPLIPSEYNNNVQIVQTATLVALMTEMIHDVRMIPIGDRPHVANGVRQWMGDSRGRWEGDTLIVETTNFSDRPRLSYDPGNAVGKADSNLRLVERFTRTGSSTLLYEFTADDPTTWERPWTARIAMSRIDGQMYEYACHEGNYAMGGMLSAGRASEMKRTNR
jgi:hypothetical protein